jgi:hypothetical protein
MAHNFVAFSRKPLLRPLESSSRRFLAFWHWKCSQQFRDSRSVTMGNAPKSRGISPSARDERSLGDSV